MLSQNATTRNSLLQVSRVITIRNYEKHALRVSRVIAVLAKSACKHAIFLATRVNRKCPRILEEISISGGVLMLYHEILLFLEVSSLS